MLFAMHGSPWDAASAQTVRGRVLDELSGLPAGRGFVVLVAEGDKEAARALSDREGRFTLQAPAPGRYRVRSERIGYLVWTSEQLDLQPEQVLSLTLSLDPIPIQLDAIEVSGDGRRCGLRAIEGQTLAIVWGEVRKVLNAAAWTSSRPYFYVRRLYDRTTGLAGDRVIEEAEHADSGHYREPFRSAPAGYLASDGYIVQGQDSLTYYAPDAKVLLHDSFLDSHCLRLTREPKTREGMIGLAFEPVQSGRRADVKGVLWVDERSSGLQELEYSYVGGVTSLTQGAGGVVQFQRLASGEWIVGGWKIRTPVAVERTRKRFGIDVTDTTVTAVREVGGEVLRIREAQDSLLYASQVDLNVNLTSVVLGTVSDLVSGLAVVGALVHIDSAGIETRTDGSGAFRLGAVPSGAIRIELRRVGYRPIDLRLQVRPGRTVHLPDSVLRLEPLGAVLLDTTIVEGEPTSRTLDGFYERRLRGIGSFLTRHEWESIADPAQLTDILQRMPGIDVSPNPNYLKPVRQVGGVDILDQRRWIVQTNRGGGVTLRGSACVPAVYVDGSYFGPLGDMDVDDLTPVAHVEAIEVYRGGSQIPVEFNGPGAACGVIVVWTKR